MGIFKRLFNGKEQTSYIPSMDGPLQPNKRLNESLVHENAAAVTDICFHAGNWLGANGSDLIELNTRRLVRRFDAAIIAITADDGRLAIAVDGEGIWQEQNADWHLTKIHDAGSVTALSWRGDDLFFTIGAANLGANDWRQDLLQKGQSGSLGVIRDGKRINLAEGLAWPSGLAVQANGQIVLSEAWKHRLLSYDDGLKPLYQDLPAYPGRIAVAETGDILLACFAPRRAIFEFVLSEDKFRQQMLRHLDPAEWIAPSLTPSTSTKNSIVQGEIRQMGVLKPWGPTASYGLVVRFNKSLQPVESWHSRADGNRHGITALIAKGEDIVALSAAAQITITLSAEDQK